MQEQLNPFNLQGGTYLADLCWALLDFFCQKKIFDEGGGKETENAEGEFDQTTPSL